MAVINGKPRPTGVRKPYTSSSVIAWRISAWTMLICLVVVLIAMSF